jgi:myo-inositol-1(or 4)-monophosphatase|tara:strand:+ start:4539 stop:5393 length:855 start_codon:yes stop_codon:yes gene_type:complete
LRLLFPPFQLRNPVSAQPELGQLVEIVTTAARTAGLANTRLHATDTKADGSIVTALDHEMQSLISTALKARWPEYSFMGEEMEHDEQASIVDGKSRGFWALDPLDGTTNFAMGFPFYGVSLALVVDGEARLGVVLDPVRDECFSAIDGGGAFLNGEPMTTLGQEFALRECVANVDYKRLVSRLADRLVRYPPYRSQRNLGACVLEWCWLAAGRLQLYLHGGQRMWDYAAGSLILKEAGGVFTTIPGNPLDCRKFTKRSVAAAVNTDLHAKWLGWIRENDEHWGK